jgi:hypothetical protein
MIAKAGATVDIDAVRKFARSKGFYDVEYEGKYNDSDLYIPFMEDREARIGKPFFILVKGEDLKIVTGVAGVEILNDICNK